MKVTMLIRWSARPIGDSTAGPTYLVTGELGEVGTGEFWAHSVAMTHEMVEDDWLPDVCARIDRLARKAFPPPMIGWPVRFLTRTEFADRYPSNDALLMSHIPGSDYQ